MSSPVSGAPVKPLKNLATNQPMHVCIDVPLSSYINRYTYIYIGRSTSQEKKARVRHMSQEKAPHESEKGQARVR